MAREWHSSPRPAGSGGGQSPVSKGPRPRAGPPRGEIGFERGVPVKFELWGELVINAAGLSGFVNCAFHLHCVPPTTSPVQASTQTSKK